MDIVMGEEGKKQVTGQFSKEFHMGRTQLAGFLRKLADEIEESNNLKISADEWEIPFEFRDEVEVEIEKKKDKLEIELEFKKYRSPPRIEVG